MAVNDLVQCYNRGCGQKYDPKNNNEDVCQHHPGEPFFHDAYKGWTCCNKKCTDFTEFLNIKGCTLSKHSNIKPPEPEKQSANNLPDCNEVIEVKPIVRATMERPPFNTQLVNMQPKLAPSLKDISEKLSSMNCNTNTPSDVIPEGTLCKNGGCKTAYSDETKKSQCIYHPGQPIFHEGLKFWSCCNKRTSDFNAFLNQAGCETGDHIWMKKDNASEEIQARYDHHQTGTHVIVTIYAKQYCPRKSEVKLNPIRMYANIVFPLVNAAFNLDLELKGIVDVQHSKVNMYGTKIEIELKKAEPGSWSRLEVPRTILPPTKGKNKVDDDEDKTLESQVESVDLSDL